MDNEFPITTPEVSLDDFFSKLKTFEMFYTEFVGSPPHKLFINPETLKRLASVGGFYQRPELGSEVTVFSPVVRRFKLQHGTVLIKEDYDENFLHFE